MVKRKRKLPVHKPKSIWKFKSSLAEIDRLAEIHQEIGGVQPGRRFGLEVLNKSSVLILCACWESFIEDFALELLAFLAKNVKDPHDIPKNLQKWLIKRLEKEKNELSLWRLTGKQWQEELVKQGRDYLQRFNTPKCQNIDGIFDELFGIKSISSYLYWPKRKANISCKMIDEFVQERGALAHGSKPKKIITKKYINDHRIFFLRAAVKMNNSCADYLKNTTNRRSWKKLTFEDIFSAA